MRYIALLRGININQKNRIAMSELKDALESLGYTHVRTCLNSGNAVFSFDETDPRLLADAIQSQLSVDFHLAIPVLVLPQASLAELLQQAPPWWGTDNRDIYNNLIFVLPSADRDDILTALGEPTAALEQYALGENSIFWSFDRKNYTKCNWYAKTAAPGIGEHLTIRTAGTLRKLISL